ncbi:MAG: ferritin-like domain-containing protein [Phycisphaerales bacterium]|jgi:ferritin-like metal-binding protein YciE
MPMDTLKNLFVGQLEELLASERHAREVMAKISKSASAPGLATALQEQAAAARQHSTRLEAILERYAPTRKSAKAVAVPNESSGCLGLMRDLTNAAEDREGDPHVRDVAMLSLAQHFLHREIAGYGCARAWARVLGDDRAVSELGRSLDDEKKADSALSKLAERVNRLAVTTVVTA